MSQYVTKVRTNDGDKQIDYNALANLPTISNPNLLINSDFRNPINQRGQITYKSVAKDYTRIFTIDRWSAQNGCGVTINNGYITLTGDVNSESTSSFSQPLEVLPIDVYTVQVKVKSLSNGADVEMMNSQSQSVFIGHLSVGINSFTVENTDVQFVAIKLGSTSSVELEWIKLEVGSVATAFSTRIYAEEVALCKRFYQVMTIYNTEIICYLHQRDANKYGGVMAIEAMRAVPTVTKTGDFYVEQYSTSGTYATMESELSSLEIIPQWSSVRFGFELSTADPVNYLSVASESCVFRFDAEIY